MSDLVAVLNSDSTIKAVLNSDNTIKAVLTSGVTVNQVVDGGAYIHFDVATTANNQQFTNSDIAQYADVEHINLFRNGIYVQPSQISLVNPTTIQVNVLLNSGDTLDILATGSAGLSGGGGGTPGGSNTQIQFNDNGFFGGDGQLTFNKITNTLTTQVANVTTLNATSGNITELTSTGNISAGNLDITGTFTITDISATGTVSGATVSATGNISANNLSVTHITTTDQLHANTANLGSVNNLTITGGTNGYVLSTNGSGILSWVAQTGGGGGGSPGGSNSQVQFNDNGTFGGDAGFTYNKTTDTITVGNISGTITTASQTNITSVGTLGSLNVTANVTAGNVKTDHLLYANGTAWSMSANPAGSNTQVQFNNNGSFAGSANMVFNTTTNTLSVTNFVGNGSGLTSIAGANVTGTVSNASTAAVANSVAGANVTGVVANATYATTSGSATSATTAGTVTTAAQPNITSVGTLTSLAVTGNVTSGNVIATHYGSGTGLTNLPGANVVGAVANATYATNAGTATTATTATSATTATTATSATTAGTVTNATQSNITTVGTLLNLTVQGNTTTGNLRTNNLQYANGVAWSFYGNTEVAQYLPTYTGNLNPSNLTATNFSSGNVTVTGGSAQTLIEPVNTVASSPISSQNIDLITGTVWYFSSPISTNTTLNIRGNASVTMNALMGTSQSLTFSVIITNPTSPSSPGYIVSNLAIDGTTRTINWVGGSAPTATVLGVDVYTFTIVKKSSNSYLVIGNRGSAS